MAYTTPRSVVTQVIQLGVETSPGVGGTADQRLTTLNSQLAPTAAGAFAVFRPSGGKYVGQVVPGDTYSEGPINDTIDFNTLPFVAGMNIGVASASAIVDSATTWVFDPTPFAQDTGKTFVVDEGVDGAFYRYRNVTCPDLNLHLMRTGTVTLGGRMLGRKIGPQTGSLSSPTSYQGRAMSPLAAGLYSGTSWADLVSSTTRLVPPGVDFVFRHNGVFAPWFSLDDSVISFEGLLDGAIDAGIQVTVPANVSGTDLEGVFNVTKMETNVDVWLKLLALGPLIGATSTYKIELLMHCVISAPPRRGAQGNLRTWQWDATLIPDTVTPFLPFRLTVVDVVPKTALGIA